MLNRRTPGVLLGVALLVFGAIAPLVAQQNVSRAAAAPVAGPDTTALAREATGWLIDLIRINTTNPPGNEWVAAKYVAGILEKEGINAELLEAAPGRRDRKSTRLNSSH